MASKTVVEFVDDLDGSLADETVTFALAGVEYAIDLSAVNAARLRAVFEDYIGSARRVAASKPRRLSEAARAKAAKAEREDVTAEIRRLASTAQATRVEPEDDEPEPDDAPVAPNGNSPTVTRPTLADEPASASVSAQPPAPLLVPFQEATL